MTVIPKTLNQLIKCCSGIFSYQVNFYHLLLRNNVGPGYDHRNEIFRKWDWDYFEVRPFI